MKTVYAMLICFAVIGSAPRLMADEPRHGTPVVFVAIDSIDIVESSLIIEGVEKDTGATVKTELGFSHYGVEACQRAAMLVMLKPGRFMLKAYPATGIEVATCKLVRN